MDHKKRKSCSYDEAIVLSQPGQCRSGHGADPQASLMTPERILALSFDVIDSVALNIVTICARFPTSNHG